MIKFYTFTIAVIASALAVYRFIVPALFSLSDDFAMVLAAVIALSYPAALVVITKNVWKRKKK
ncbi:MULTISPECIES: hypothetical protein [Enterobacteriaceae]|uniref:hypothetical protein n=1 Tax=Enterobacteriaceae TaxID=543 RepID=UPI0012A2A321|nr:MULTISPECIES: hypothetical protein [Enterobacteriaceae]MEB5924728.1 hypothetical protein [Franconibacter daqui]